MSKKGKVTLGPDNTSSLSRELASEELIEGFRQLVLNRPSPCCGAEIMLDENESRIIPRCSACGEEGPTFCKNKSEKYS